MYKIKKFEKNISKNYLKYQNTGLVGYLMGACHKNLENKFIKKNGIVLEIGPGTSPHINYLNGNFEKYFMLDSSLFTVNFLKKKFIKNKNVIIKRSTNSSIPFENNSFDRVIMSHVLEHVSDPESFLFKILSKLKNGGYLSISLPTDPGFLWRLGRFYQKAFNVKDKLNLSNRDYDYMIATEHVNSIFNLISILKYHFKNNIVCEEFLPLKFLKSADCNLFYNLTIIKSKKSS
jgi:SAM-dependent methyltransferase